VSSTPLTLLLVGPEQAGLAAQLERLRGLGALVAHIAEPARALQVLGTLLPDLLLAPSAPAALPRGVRWLAWDGDPATLPGLLAPRLPSLRQGGSQRLGQLQIDETRGLVSLPPHEIHVPATELRLLLCLGRHGGRAVSRQQLLAEVWPAEAQPQPRSVDQVVRRLRQLLQGLGLAGRLRSLRGLGYRLDLDPLSRV
jgi:DNA-binding response OmpR family regulator